MRRTYYCGLWSRSSVTVIIGLLLLACAPATAPTRTAQPEPAGAPSAPAAAQVSVPGKPLNMALPIEPGALGGKIGSGRSGLDEYAWIFAAALVRVDFQGAPVPVLVEEIPSLEKGTWRVFDDRRMETVYKLRPSATWHDGTPFTAEDVIFTWQAIMNPEVPAIDRVPERTIETIEAPDPRTVVIRWRETNVLGNSYQLEPLPRHIFEPLLQRDPQSFTNATYWTRDWVGLGAYKVADFVPGSHVRGQAFAGYVLGAPKIEEITVHFIPDANQAVARMLAGALDLSLGSLIRVEEGVLLKEQLEARGEGTVITTPEGGVRSGELQFREPQTPAARDVRVRQAMYHAMDRTLMIDTLQFGLVQPAHMLLAPGDPAFEPAERAVRKYDFNLTRAQQLLAEAGWTRTPEGILRNAAGERFDFGIRVTEGTLNNKEAQVVAEFFKNVGITSEVEITPRARQNDQQYRATFPGVALGSPVGEPEGLVRYRSEAIPTEANNWRGNNRGGWTNSEFDRLTRDYFQTIELGPRVQAHVDALRLMQEELPLLPLYYQADVYGVRVGLKGVAPAAPGEGWTTFNAHRLYWER